MTTTSKHVSGTIRDAATTAREVFSGQCSGTKDAIDYFEQLLINRLAAIQPDPDPQPVATAICKGCGKEFRLSDGHDCHGPFATPSSAGTVSVEAAGWQPIDQTPAAPIPVLLFFANGHFKTSGGDWAPARTLGDPCRDERFGIGFWDGSYWCENGTGHDLFEDYRGPYWHPTHWMPLPEPPALRALAGERE